MIPISSQRPNSNKIMVNCNCLRQVTLDIEMRNLMIEHDVVVQLLRADSQIPSDYEIFSGYLLHKASARDYDLREKVAEQVFLMGAVANGDSFERLK